jgi:hypothetical protein
VEEMIECNDCDLRYCVVWNHDGGESPVEYCPRCGSADLTLPKENIDG